MRNFLSKIILIATLATACKAAPVPETRTDLIRRVADSSVIVMTDHGRGSGTVVGYMDGAVILTCAHVVDDAKALNIRAGKEDFAATLLAMDTEHDLALLVAPYATLPILKVADREPDLFAEVLIVAAPGGYSGTAATGVISSKNEKTPLTGDREIWRVTGFGIAPGASGGTITNTQGELVCIPAIAAVGVYPVFPQGFAPLPYMSIGFCLPLKDVRTFLKENNAIGARLDR